MTFRLSCGRPRSAPSLVPNLMQPAADLADPTGLPPLAGPYVVTGAALALAAVVVWVMLRPDPLLLGSRARWGDVGALPDPTQNSLLHFASSAASPGALFGVAALAVGHCVMVMVMVMTPVHMEHVDVTLTVIGLVISVHILGHVRAFRRWSGCCPTAPVPRWSSSWVRGFLGWPRWWRVPRQETAVLQLGIGLFLLGLGWSCTLIAGSALLTRSVEPADRPAVQGAGDTVMNVRRSGGRGGRWGGGVHGLVRLAECSRAASGSAAGGARAAVRRVALGSNNCSVSLDPSKPAARRVVPTPGPVFPQASGLRLASVGGGF